MRFFRPNESEPETVVVNGATETDVKAAYERGRRDERGRRRTHPILGLIVFVIALIGAGMIYLAARPVALAMLWSITCPPPENEPSRAAR